MMKRSHFLVGGAAGVAVAHTIGDSILAGGIVGGLAGLLPDVDHPHSAVGRLLPLWWPFRRRRTVFLGALAFRTRSWAEALVVLGVVAGVGYWVSL